MHNAIPEHVNSCKWCGEGLRGGGDFHPECEEQDEAAHAYERQAAAGERDAEMLADWQLDAEQCERLSDGFDEPRDRDGYAGIVGAGLGMYGEG